MNTSGMKRLTVSHRDHTIKIAYWIDYSDSRKIVDWNIHEPSERGYSTTIEDGYVRESLGGKSGVFGIGARPERSFHEMIAEAVEKAIQWINENSEKVEVPEPEDIVETLEIRGYDATPKRR